MRNDPAATLLVVEDSDEDYMTLQRIFRKLIVTHPMERCANAQECLDYLKATKEQGSLPALMLLDLNMPGIDGFTLLRHLKSEAEFKHIPIVIVTTSSNPRDIQACYEEGASSYLLKQLDYTMFEQSIRRFVDYWFDTVLLPLPVESP